MDFSWLANISIVLAVVAGIIKIILWIFTLAQKLLVAPLSAQLADLTAQIGTFGEQVKELTRTLTAMGERVAKIEASAKSAHHRIDTLEERVDAHIGDSVRRED